MKDSYAQAENRGRRFTRIGIIVMVGVYGVGYLLLVVAVVLYNTFVGNFDVSRWYHINSYK